MGLLGAPLQDAFTGHLDGYSVWLRRQRSTEAVDDKLNAVVVENKVVLYGTFGEATNR